MTSDTTYIQVEYGKI